MAKNVYVIDDGTREVILKNKFGQEICTLHFRASDLSILDRYNDVIKGLADILKPLEALDISNDGNAINDRDWAIVKKAEGAVKQRINKLLDMTEADEIFRTRNPFSSVGGKFFVEHVFAALGQAIKDAGEEEAELSRSRTKAFLKDLDESKEAVSGNAGAAAD